MTRWRGVRQFAALVAAATITACAVVAEPAQPAPFDPAGPVAGGSEPPTGGGTLRIGLGVEPASIDPRFVVDLEGEIVVGALFEPLVRLDDQLRVIPAAATQWTVDDTRTVYRFTLRPADFHDGSPVTAEAFKRTFDRLADGTATPRSPLGFLVDGIVGTAQSRSSGGTLTGVQVEDDDVLVIRLERPDVNFLTRLAHPALGPLPEAAERDPTVFAQRPVGNGAFQMPEPRTPGAYIRLTANADHHRPPNVDEVLMTFYLDDPSATRQWQDLRAGVLHVARITPDLADEAVEVFGRSFDGYTGPGLIDGITTTIYAYAFNIEVPPFDDERARLAWSLAIDRDAIATDVMRGTRTAAHSLVPPSIPGHQRDSCTACRHDPDLAAQLWAEAVADWQQSEGPDSPTPSDSAPPLSDDGSATPVITLVHPRGASHAAIAERMAEDLENTLEVRINLRAEPLNRFVSLVRNGQAAVFRLGWEPTEPTLGAYLEPLLHSREIGRDNLTGWSSPAYDELIDAAKASPWLGSSMANYRRAEILALDASPILPLLYYRHTAVVTDDVEGFRWSPTGHIDLADVTIAR